MEYMDLKMCNCAGCSRRMMGASMAFYLLTLPPSERTKLPPMVAGRIHDRPYCEECLSGTQFVRNGTIMAEAASHVV
jgi:hypothetical protein